MADDGVVIDMNALSTIDAVLKAVLTRGLAPPVLTNYLQLSIGGTLRFVVACSSTMSLS